MTKEELKNKYSAFIAEISEILGLGKPIDILKLCATTDLFFQPLEKHIEELERENEKLKKRLGVLLSCKNCPDNKGGFICQKEYEDKCLTQKIQYIKELKEENTELEKENANLKARLNAINLLTPELEKQSKTKKQQLTKAKELLKKIEKIVYSGENEIKRLSKIVDILAEAEQFLKE